MRVKSLRLMAPVLGLLAFVLLSTVAYADDPTEVPSHSAASRSISRLAAGGGGSELALDVGDKR